MPKGDQVMETPDDTRALSSNSKETDKGAAPVNRTSYKEVLSAPKEQQSLNIAGNTSSATDSAPTSSKKISLSTLGIKKGDTDNKRSRSAAEQLSDQEQPSTKKPPSVMSVAVDAAQNATLAARDLPTVAARSDAVRGAAQMITSVACERSKKRERAVEEEVRMSCHNVRWVKGRVPAVIDHWFYDLRECGTEPPASLVAASRNMVLKWKSALGRAYYPLNREAGGSVLRVEHAHRTFKAVTLNMVISGWTSRACAKHQSMHDQMDIPMIVARDGDPLKTRPCPLIYYY